VFVVMFSANIWNTKLANRNLKLFFIKFNFTKYKELSAPFFRLVCCQDNLKLFSIKFNFTKYKELSAPFFRSACCKGIWTILLKVMMARKTSQTLVNSQSKKTL
jgi:hypothetical protein